MKRIAIAFSFFLALVVPAFAVSSATDSEAQTVTLEINKALEGTAATGEALTATAPSGSSNVNAPGADLAAVSLRSNANWNASIKATNSSKLFMEKGGVPMKNKFQVSDSVPGPTASFVDIAAAANPIATGSRNGVADGTTTEATYNSAQTYRASFRQPVSWADEAGAYSISVTHDLAN